MNDETWLAELKPGDEVAYTILYGRTFVFDRVARVTAAQIALCGDKRRFNRETGRQIGGTPTSYNVSYLYAPDVARKHIQNAEDAKTEAQKKHDRIRKIESRLPKLTVEQLDAIIEALAKAESKTGEGK